MAELDIEELKRRPPWRAVERLLAELSQCSDELGSTRMALNDEMYKRDAERKDRERLRAVLKDLAWNETDGRCWCLESPERHDMRHSKACLNAKAALKGRDG